MKSRKRGIGKDTSYILIFCDLHQFYKQQKGRCVLSERKTRPERIEKKLVFLIEFSAEADSPQKPGDISKGKIEISVNEKARYRINYSLDSDAAVENLRRKIDAIAEEFEVIIKTTTAVIGHRIVVKTIELNEKREPIIESIEDERHVPQLIEPNAYDNPQLSKNSFYSLAKRLEAAAPKMKQYADLLIELRALSTIPDFSHFKEAYDLILPRVRAAKKAAKSYVYNREKNWARKIYDEFPEYQFSAEDLIVRLPEDQSLIPEKIRLAIESTGADMFRASHIALELIARVSAGGVYQYSVKRLEEIKAGKLSETTKTRKRIHENSITRGEAITLISHLLNG